MTTIKSYTDLEQSKKLAEILPLESADLKWFFWAEHFDEAITPSFGYRKSVAESYKDTNAIYLPCWSLSALLSVLPNYHLQTQDNGIGIMCSCKKGHMQTIEASNPIDACYEMILKLHELNLL